MIQISLNLSCYESVPKSNNKNVFVKNAIFPNRRDFIAYFIAWIYTMTSRNVKVSPLKDLYACTAHKITFSTMNGRLQWPFFHLMISPSQTSTNREESVGQTAYYATSTLTTNFLTQKIMFGSIKLGSTTHIFDADVSD